MRTQRGYSLIELMAAILILTIVITITLMAFMERARRMKQASDLMRAYQCLANEAEYVRRLQYAGVNSAMAFHTDTAILAPLGPFTRAEMEVVPVGTHRKDVTLVIRWRQGSHDKEAKLGLIRTNTGGQNLW
jgi:prepilin-type N-terminal cleavage/methylation domain-containing protein